MKLTIFTPTYNRTSELTGLYHSIMSAISFIERDDSVEWMIVDDGSEIDYKEIIEGFSELKKLSIRYFKKKHEGKHAAFNYAIDACDGDLFVCIDDDDRMTDHSISDIFNLAREFKSEEKYINCGGFVGRVVNPEGEKQGKNLNSYPLISNTIEIRDKYHFWGEPEVYFTEVIKQFHFDLFEGEFFLTEAYLFDELTMKYPLIYTDCVMMKKVFLKGGLTDNNLIIRIKSPRGTEEYYYRRSKRCKGFMHRLKATINRQRFSFWIRDERPHRRLDIYEVLARPLSFIMYLRDRRTNINQC